MKSWKTTVFGTLAAVGAYLATVDNPTLKTIGQVVGMVSTFLLGASAKDNNVTGGTKPQ